MPTQDAALIKEKVISILRRRGPILPVPLSSELEISPLFASAFLSELVAEKKIRISFMKVGNSPLYFLAGQEPLLERFSHHLKSREKDAFELLQNKKFLKDIEQDPAIRVALRSIRDFAIPFKKNDEIFWRYFTVNELESRIKEAPKKEEKELGIFEEKGTSKPKPKKTIKRKKTTKKNDIFFNKVKEFLSNHDINIIEVENLAKNELILKVKLKEKENLLFAYNKKRISEADIIKAGKKASELNLSYTLLSKGGPLKKVENLLRALGHLNSIETLK